MPNNLESGLKILLSILAIAFFYEIYQAGSWKLSAGFLAAIGGTSPALVAQNNLFYLRIFTALFLHGNLMHLFFNALGIIIGGSLLERLVSKQWFWLVFLYSGALGSIYSILFSKFNSVSVGASGGVMGIFSCALVLVNFKVIPKYRRNLNIVLLQGLVPSLIPLVSGIDYAAHFGGALGGAVLGFLILAFWPRNLQKPNFSEFAQLLNIVFLICTAFALNLTVFQFI